MFADLYSGDDWFINSGAISSAAWTQYTFYGVSPGTNATGNCRFLSSNGNTEFYIDDVSIKEVTNAWESLPPHGTAVVWWRPGQASTSFPGSNYGILKAGATTTLRLLYTNAGVIYASDGTTTAEGPTSFSANRWLKCVVQWGYLTSNVAKFRVGYDNGTGLTWGTAQTFNGDFGVGTQLVVGYNPFGSNHFTFPTIYPRILTDAEINGMGSP